MPRSASRSPSRCRKTSPRALAMSRIPIVNPSRRSGRGRRGLMVRLRSEVGSKSTVIRASFSKPLKSGFCVQRRACFETRLWALLSMRKSLIALRKVPHPEEAAKRPSRRTHGALPVAFRSGFDLLGYGKAAAGAARGPAADDAGEHPGVAAGADDQEAARTELVDHLTGERGRAAFGNPLSARDKLVTRDFAQP